MAIIGKNYSKESKRIKDESSPAFVYSVNTGSNLLEHCCEQGITFVCLISEQAPGKEHLLNVSLFTNGKEEDISKTIFSGMERSSAFRDLIFLSVEKFISKKL